MSSTTAEAPAVAADGHRGTALVAATVEGMAGESFVATTNPMCRTCDQRRCCPVQVEGQTT